MLVKLRGLSKSFGAMVAVHPLDLDIEQGDFLAILGPSGCGKTTLLRMMGGSSSPDRPVEIAGRTSPARAGEAPDQHGVPGLRPFPAYERAAEHAYGLKLAARRRDEIDRRSARC